MRKILALSLALAGCTGGKPPPLVPDYGPEEVDKADSATRPAITLPINYGQTISVALGNGGVNWRAFQFPGSKGQTVDAYAQGLNDTDTVLYLYKISRITGRPYGKPVGYNDDTIKTGWSLRKTGSFNQLSSSIIGAVLPEDRDYALVLTTYEQAGGNALLQVQSRGAVIPTTIPPFAGTSAGTAIHFYENLGNGNERQVLDAKRYAPSTQIQTALAASASTGLIVTAAVYKAASADLAAALKDPARKADLAYGLLLGDANTNGYDARWTPIDPANAVATLMHEASPDEDNGLPPLLTFVVRSMFDDNAFRAGDVSTYLIHWDNSDDTHADGIAAIKSTTGEIRVLSIDSPP